MADNTLSKPLPIQDGSLFGEDPMYRMLDDIFTSGVVSGLSVIQSASGVQVDVQAGDAYVAFTSPSFGGKRRVNKSATSSSGTPGAPNNPGWETTFATPDGTNPRVDRVVLKVYDNILDGSGKNLAVLRVVTGTPTGGANLTNLSGAAAVPVNSILLANVLVGAAAASIPTGNIDNTVRATCLIGGSVLTPPGVPTGTTFPTMNSVAPAGYLLADGSAVSRTTYAALYALCSGNKQYFARSHATLVNTGNVSASLGPHIAALTGAITNVATTMTVNTPLSGAMGGNILVTNDYIVIGNSEICQVTANVGTTTWTISRAQLATSAVAHAAGESVLALPYTTLNGAISSAGATTITVTANAMFPQTFDECQGKSGCFVVQVDSEQMLVTSGIATNTWTVTRGYNGTTAATHSNAAVIWRCKELPFGEGDGSTTFNVPDLRGRTVYGTGGDSSTIMGYHDQLQPHVRGAYHANQVTSLHGGSNAQAAAGGAAAGFANEFAGPPGKGIDAGSYQAMNWIVKT